MPHSLTDLVVHVIFSTKDRRPLLVDSLRPRLFVYIKAIVHDRRARLLTINGSQDHLHLLVEFPAGLALADLMRFVKGGSSRWIRTELDAQKAFGWQQGYAAFSVSHSQLDHVYYIARQQEHHAKVEFRDELIAFLKKHEVSYDDRYLSV